mgnify:CR=1 FL=1
MSVVTDPPTPSNDPMPLQGRTFQAIKGVNGKVTYVGKDVMRAGNELYNFGKTAAQHMTEPGRRVPL